MIVEPMRVATNISRSTVLLSSCLMAILLGACAGTVIVEFDVDPKVTVKSKSGAVTAAGEITSVPRSPQELSIFPSKRYRDDKIDWSLGAGDYGFGGYITNLGDKDLCLDFDRATIASNFHPRAVPLRVFSVVTRVDKEWTRLGSTNPATRSYFDASAVCIPPGKPAALISMGLDLRAIFPNETMFNVRWPEGETILTEKGLGNWFRISVPRRYGADTETMEIQLTLRESRARKSYH